MSVDPKAASGHGPRRFSPRILTSIFVIVLTVLIFLLVRTMVLHRFYRGGTLDQNVTAGP